MTELLNPLFQATIIGDGSHYIDVDGKMLPLVSRSATDRLRHGDRATVYITDTGYVDLPTNVRWHRKN